MTMFFVVVVLKHRTLIQTMLQPCISCFCIILIWSFYTWRAKSYIIKIWSPFAVTLKIFLSMTTASRTIYSAKSATIFHRFFFSSFTYNDPTILSNLTETHSLSVACFFYHPVQQSPKSSVHYQTHPHVPDCSIQSPAMHH